MRNADALLPGADHSDLDAPTEAYADGAFLVGEVGTGAGTEVVAADNLQKGTRDRVPDGAEFVEADLRDAGDVADLITDD